MKKALTVVLVLGLMIGLSSLAGDSSIQKPKAKVIMGLLLMMFAANQLFRAISASI